MKANSSYVYENELHKNLLFKLSSKKRLATLLGFDSFHKIKNIINDKDALYKKFTIDTQSTSTNEKKSRLIQKPILELSLLQGALFRMLKNLKTPEYLHSVSKHSSITNAKAHIGVKGKTLNVDISDFYTSTKYSNIYRFYSYYLQCSPDVSYVLAKISTYNDYIPTGSRVSSLVAFFANKPLFDELNRLSKSYNIVMTVYVDDISFTGSAVTNNFLDKVEKILCKHNMSLNKKKIKFFSSNLKFITGVALHNNRLEPPHKHLKSIREGFFELKNPAVNDDMVNFLRGKINFITQIDPKFKCFQNVMVSDINKIVAIKEYERMYG